MLEPIKKLTKKQKIEANTIEFEGIFPCPLCFNGLIVKKTKNNKPYCICLDCGIQLFIRGKEGINRLKAFLSENSAEKIINSEYTDSISNSKRAVIILNQIEQVKKQINKIEDNMGFWDSIFGNEEKEQTLKILKKDLETLKIKLRTISKGEIPS